MPRDTKNLYKSARFPDRPWVDLAGSRMSSDIFTMREIEIKIRVDDMDLFEKNLVAQGCVLSKPIHQHDTVYLRIGETSIWEGVKSGSIVLRIRRDDDGALFTLKQQQTHELDNAEFETRIADPDALHESLLIMGFRPGIEVKKVRRTGTLDGDEICLDTVEELGTFVELERLAIEDVDPRCVTKELYKKLESLGLSRRNEERRGYDTQLYQLHKKQTPR